MSFDLIIHSLRSILIDRYAFVEVETPLLFKATPGGADEFLVPSGQEPPQCYSLPQSPQQYKQILMVAGIDRYFQIAKCFRNEAIHRDRQPEFTQLDIELTCTTPDRVMDLVERLILYAWLNVGHLKPLCPQTPFRVLTYEDAMLKYGTDKPDVRFGWTLSFHEDNDTLVIFHMDSLDLADMTIDYAAIEFRLGQLHLEEDVGYVVFDSNDKLLHKREPNSSEGQDYAENDLSERFLQSKFRNSHVIVWASNQNRALAAAGAIRTLLADEVEKNAHRVRLTKFAFAWITDFPLFEYSRQPDGSHQLVASHHPFTAPRVEDLHLLETDPTRVRGQQYDLVLNGEELGGGSIRIHDAELQRFILEQILKMDVQPFSHLLKILKDGAPPHGGIALGLDRYLAILTKSKSIRDVIAFPKSQDGRDLLCNAPDYVSPQRLAQFKLKVTA